ncbi:hypothetical protein ACFWH4_06510 [Streptomyces sp. NPDC127091]|uniref:hypothetical protein n=1 Tax=Streptomyces sp. NPDC127091 TaxID=3347134 RepID=UPI003658065F
MSVEDQQGEHARKMREAMAGDAQSEHASTQKTHASMETDGRGERGVTSLDTYFGLHHQRGGAGRNDE